MAFAEDLGTFSMAYGLIHDIFSNDPHALGMQFSAGNNLNTVYFDALTDQYFEITSRKVGKDGSVTEVYDTYSSYSYDSKKGVYVGVGKTGSYSATQANPNADVTQQVNIVQ
ncbi:hypothetical protein [Mucilaginibacter gotjawali]|nr:hypothetical protein [Mucilaginibacter gotjawali]MBB3058135.1 hypothetical protein [Mucilaginibacter gotjawali]